MGRYSLPKRNKCAKHLPMFKGEKMITDTGYEWVKIFYASFMPMDANV
jgi:hypothetical protein